MRTVASLTDRARERDSKSLRLLVAELAGLLAVFARYLDSRAAREFVRTIAFMIPSLLDQYAKQTGQPTRGLAEIYVAMQKDPHRVRELKAEGRALAAELGLSVFASLFDDDAIVGDIDVLRIFNVNAIADFKQLAARIKADTTP